jgi:hypothetical protein
MTYFTTPSLAELCEASNYKVENNEDDGKWAQLIVAEFEIPSCHFLERTEADHKNWEMNKIPELSERL